MNKNMLICAIKDKKYTIASFCEKIGMSYSAFNRRMNREVEFSLAEIQTIINVLDLKTVDGIFFTF